MKASLNAAGARGRGERRGRDGDRRARRRTSTGCWRWASSRTFGLDAGRQETSYGLPYEPVNLGAGSVYKIFTTATALEKGLGINYQMTVPPVRLRLPDLRRRQRAADPGAERRQLRRPAVDAPTRWRQSPNTAFIKLEEFTGVPDVVDMAVRLGMKSLATTPFVDPNTGRRTDRSIAEVTKAQKQASFTLGVSPTSVLELANVGATLASGGKWCPPSPDRVGHRPERAARAGHRGAVRPGRRAGAGEHAVDGAEQGRPARRHRRRRRPARSAGTGRSRARPAPPSSTSPRRSSGSSRRWPGR